MSELKVQFNPLALKVSGNRQIVRGIDGITPTVTITEITGGHEIAFYYGEDDPRNTSFNVLDGQTGEMAVVEVAESAPVITCAANTRYVCGEVSSISITPTATGVCDIIFTSGATAAVLTVPNTVIFPAWFNPASLETNSVYEINILDGIYAAVISWGA